MLAILRPSSSTAFRIASSTIRTMSSQASAPQLTLYTVGTPNGQKVSIALEELGLKYKTRKIDFASNEQKADWFIKINPNGRIPALVDESRGNFAVMESTAILFYLAEHYDPNHILLPKDANARSEVTQWAFFQHGGLGPMQGQANHFFRYAPEKIPYGIKRYQDETKRLYSVMELGLQKDGGRDFLAGEYSLADIACFGWVAGHNWAGVSLDEFPLLDKWLHRVAARDAVKRGMNVPDPNTLIERDFKVPDDADKKAEDAKKWIHGDKDKK
ncbi:hypothetical protein HDU88_005496 [Geranomyces variabilis]|nr:hypothetical protein HDU88_005496 [Geranomyces variabilis]